VGAPAVHALLRNRGHGSDDRPRTRLPNPACSSSVGAPLAP
jgi:hypothetical protein